MSGVAVGPELFILDESTLATMSMCIRFGWTRCSSYLTNSIITQSNFTQSIFTQSIFTQSIVTPNIITRSHNLLLLVHTLHGPVDIDLQEYDVQHHALHLLGLLPLEPVHFLEHVLAAHGVSLPVRIRGHVVSLEGHFGQIRPRLAPQGQHNRCRG